jgi:hypothetical protein
MAKSYKEYLKEAGNVHLAYYIEAADILGIDYDILVYRLMAKFTYQDKHWFIINTVTHRLLTLQVQQYPNERI